ncbi:type I-C CRISPR-associated endonuclease Cas1c [Olsenella sp. YH-ols2217]|uniref:CRISPR-associated endonuclease Cas1 n=1 Tax=Kribbibacterium absianum TaxID=3044210 RepID=A0ABT6ZK55_9ACTN|nr:MULTISPECIES: type I-C CRISPR-associated endonuclease Cas1c [unclassified Olsenella]MDJ1122921.1 type I-C CRISPR-associated endonuclease Cas1c [Olsenella sp. YH-ols2216]MDJ1129428.1 type I-C CRISPR-associated endonuclease Cas1c [Olsenella sp. YH-ols2217]
MRKLRNTLYVETEDAYLALEGENVVVKGSDQVIGRVPLHTLESIVSFSYRGASPALMGKCAQDGVTLAFFSPTGQFLARTTGETHGNVLLRREQYRRADCAEASTAVARAFIQGKVFNCRWLLERSVRDHGLRLDGERVATASARLQAALGRLESAPDVATVRAVEGNAASEYFGVFGELVLRNREFFSFGGRSRRPPLDSVNALLSFAYSLLATDCAGALEAAGLDCFVGFLHCDRAGRRSLALDLMEELRPVFVDRFVLTLINNQVVGPKDFETRETGEVRIAARARRRVLEQWQARKRREVTHPYLKEKIRWGEVPFAQAMLLAKHLRGDLDGYPPFFWK